MASKKTTTASGYGSRHQKIRKYLAAQVAAGEAVCWRCQLPIEPGTPWDLGHHDQDRSRYMGPEHSSCNRSSAASRGNRMRAGIVPTYQPAPDEVSRW
jgi:hypothetical protein